MFKFKEILIIFISAIISSSIIPFIFCILDIDFITCFYFFIFFFCFVIVFIISDSQYLTRGSNNDWDGTDNQ
jgi:hypothetical protein